MPVIVARNLRAGYGELVLARALELSIRAGTFTAIIGPSGSGKTTLLKTLAAVIPALSGSVLAGEEGGVITARVRAYLPQQPSIHPETTVEDLAALGRYTHNTWYRQWDHADRAVVDWALTACGVVGQRKTRVGELSGGQVQRARLASVLSQEAAILFLDEPVTYLDPAHQVEVLELVRHLVDQHGKTVVAILHDVWQLGRYADVFIAMKEGNVAATGPIESALTPSVLSELYGIEMESLTDPETGRTLHFPKGPPRVTQI